MLTQDLTSLFAMVGIIAFLKCFDTEALLVLVS